MRWIVGDVHGMLAALEGLLHEVHAVDAAASFYFAGDFVNRGPDSRRVVDLLLSLQGARFARGNHDDVFDLVCSGESYVGNATPGRRLEAFSLFCQHGLVETLTSYGVPGRLIDKCRHRPNPSRLNDLAKHVPDAHRQFFRDLRGAIVEGDLFVMHARLSTSLSTVDPPLEESLLNDPELRQMALWDRFTLEQLTVPKQWGRRGFFGHTPTIHYMELLRGGSFFTPVFGDGVVLLDTAAAMAPEGRLTAVCADDNTVIQVTPQGRLVS